MTSRRVVVVGGGITGLTTAYRLTTLDPSLEITVLESLNRLGGMIRTGKFAGSSVDEGADSFLARIPEATDLCRELGIDNRLISPSVDGATVYSRGKIRRIPDELALGVPTSFFQLARSGIVSLGGAIRAGMDLFKPDDWPGQDESVGDLISRRLGAEVAQRLVDPLIGGINASDTYELSARMATPTIAHVARRNRSLIRGMRSFHDRTRHVSGQPAFHSFAGGMSVLVDRLEAALDTVDLKMSAPAHSISAQGDTYTVHSDAGDISAESIVLACPASTSASSLAGISPNAAELLGRITYASVAITTVSLRSTDIAHPLEGAGLLIPRPEGMLTTAVTWGHLKWPHWSEDPDRAVLRISSGRHGDDRAMQLDDDELVEALSAELGDLLEISGPILEWKVTRWPNSLPQYPPGHGDRVTAIEATLRRDAPRVFVTGASYRGVGIPACIDQANDAAQAVIDAIGPRE